VVHLTVLLHSCVDLFTKVFARDKETGSSMSAHFDLRIELDILRLQVRIVILEHLKFTFLSVNLLLKVCQLGLSLLLLVSLRLDLLLQSFALLGLLLD